MYPLFFLLHKPDGHACRKHKNYDNTYNFLVDDLKSYASSTNTFKTQLDLVAAFSEDNGMILDEDKCAYWQIQKRNFHNAKVVST